MELGSKSITAADLRIAYVSDGITVAQSIAKKFTRNKYNMFVELLDLRYRPSSFELLSNSTANNLKANMTVLLVTPAIVRYLEQVNGQTRSFLNDLMISNQVTVTIRCFVPPEQVQEIREMTLNNADVKWRHLEIGESRESFQQCMVNLISIMEEGHEIGYVPTLKKYRLFPSRPVLAGDTMYILLDKQLVGSVHDQSLGVMFKDGCQTKANQIADCLFQFEVPECSKSSYAMEVFTSSGQSIGRDIIRYRDRFQVLTYVIKDILCQVEEMCHTMLLNELLPAATSSFVTDWLTSNNTKVPYPDMKKLIAQWTKYLRSTSVSPTCASQELPILLYLLTKYNPHASINNTSEADPWLSVRNILNKIKPKSDQVTPYYQRFEKSETSVKQFETPSLSLYRRISATIKEANLPYGVLTVQLVEGLEHLSDPEGYVGGSIAAGDEGTQLYVCPDHWTANKPLQKSKCKDQAKCQDASFENSHQRKPSTASAPTQRAVNVNLVRKHVSQSYSSDVNTWKYTPPTNQQPYYVNIASFTQKSQLSQEVCTLSHQIFTNSIDSVCPSKHVPLGMEKYDNFPKVINESLHTPSKEVASSEISIKEGDERYKFQSAGDLEAANVTNINNESLLDYQNCERILILPKPSHTTKYSIGKNTWHQEQENLSQKFEEDGNNKLHLLSSPNNDSSKPFVTYKPEVTRSLSLTYIASISNSSLFNTHSSNSSLTRFDDEILQNFHCKTALAPKSPLSNMGSQKSVNSSEITSLDAPYSSTPPPLFPKHHVHRDKHQLLKRTRSESWGLSVGKCTEKDDGFKSVKYPGNRDSDKRFSPDYPQSLNIGSKNLQTGNNLYDVLKAYPVSEQEESIYVDVDEEWENTDFMENNYTIDAPKSSWNSEMLTSSLPLSTSKPSSSAAPKILRKYLLIHHQYGHQFHQS